jgi:phytoene dehydrogenase-like protein
MSEPLSDQAQEERWSPSRASSRRSRQALPERVDVAIVGAGLGGLEAGARLARAGKRVAVFDGHYVAGGSCTMFQRRGPGGLYTFDIGLHYVGECGPEGTLTRLLGEAGVALEWEQLDPDGFDTLVFPDFRFRIPASREVYRERLLALFPAERRGIDRYVRFLDEVELASRAMERSAGKPSLGMLWQMATKGRLVARYRSATIGEVLDDCTTDLRLRAVMLGQHGDYGLPPAKVSALLHAGLANHYFGGAWYPRGGGQAIADGLATVIEAAGGTVHLRHPVRKIVVRDGRAAGIEVDKRGTVSTIEAGVVLSNADLKRTFSELLPESAVPDAVRSRVAGYEMAGGLFMTCLGVEGDLRELGLGAGNIWESDGYDVDAMYANAADGVARTQGCYITSGSLKDPTCDHHAPAGYQTLEIMTLMPSSKELWGADVDDAPWSWSYRHEPRYEAAKAEVERQLIARAERLFPGLASRIVLRESATPMTHGRYTRATNGTAYGLAATPAQFMQGRPGYRTHLPGLFLCGANTRAGHGVIGALLSGRNAASAILRGA